MKYMRAVVILGIPDDEVEIFRDDGECFCVQDR